MNRRRQMKMFLEAISIAVGFGPMTSMNSSIRRFASSGESCDWLPIKRDDTNIMKLITNTVILRRYGVFPMVFLRLLPSGAVEGSCVFLS